uniref:Tumor necrosis factor n=1 Tax=Macrobrachium nipponense TaxID=159736 RepID=A0A4P8WHW8_MACNP|nr:tumor necrosis factor [Macrobrachium nipponense]
MEKTPMYAVVTPSGPQKKTRRVIWVALAVSLLGLVIVGVTGYVLKRQGDRVNALEDTVLQMQLHMEQLLQFTHEYLEYEEEDDLDNPQGVYEELTVRGVVRKKRQAPADDSDKNAGVPIYEEAYGVNLNNRFNSEGLRLYESFGDSPTSDQLNLETTESPIKPYHRVSNLWVPKKRRQRYPPASGPELSPRAQVKAAAEDDSSDYENYDAENIALPRQVGGGGGGGRRRAPVLQRSIRVKATARNDGFPSTAGLNSVVPQTSEAIVVPQTPTVVRQGPQSSYKAADALVNPYAGKDVRKKRPRKKSSRRGDRRRGARSTITLGHFVAAPANRTAHHVSGSDIHDEWTPAAWMDNLGLNRKYTLRRGLVTVKESGLYYLYAQVLYEQGRFGTGFQVMVDGIPVMECTMAPSQPSHSCHTSGTTYLQRNAAVSIRDRESHMTAVRREENSFFGLIKLMDAPESAEKLLLG